MHFLKLLKYCFTINCVLVWHSVQILQIDLHNDGVSMLELQVRRCAELCLSAEPLEQFPYKRERECNKWARCVIQHQFSQQILLVQWLDLAQVLIVREPVVVLHGCHSGADNEKYFFSGGERLLWCNVNVWLGQHMEGISDDIPNIMLWKPSYPYTITLLPGFYEECF